MDFSRPHNIENNIPDTNNPRNDTDIMNRFFPSCGSRQLSGGQIFLIENLEETGFSLFFSQMETSLKSVDSCQNNIKITPDVVLVEGIGALNFYLDKISFRLERTYLICLLTGCRVLYKIKLSEKIKRLEALGLLYGNHFRSSRCMAYSWLQQIV